MAGRFLSELSCHRGGLCRGGEAGGQQAAGCRYDDDKERGRVHGSVWRRVYSAVSDDKCGVCVTKLFTGLGYIDIQAIVSHIHNIASPSQEDAVVGFKGERDLSLSDSWVWAATACKN
ncbi:hypothetical protein NDU88_000361 [Pleurodeles waltl]|uniref:Uncharacterized protein n=1 Tax=Pleurodeles waltl TaxID=8319 RepID=A0AAV7VX66_PLEWA|nr:hypothetical protein NDU88_000361 [Pleurodeles waltl]